MQRMTAEEALAAWRAAERRLAEATTTAERIRARVEIENRRAAYEAVVEAVAEAHREDDSDWLATDEPPVAEAHREADSDWLVTDEPPLAEERAI